MHLYLQMMGWLPPPYYVIVNGEQAAANIEMLFLDNNPMLFLDGSEMQFLG